MFNVFSMNVVEKFFHTSHMLLDITPILIEKNNGIAANNVREIIFWILENIFEEC